LFWSQIVHLHVRIFLKIPSQHCRSDYTQCQSGWSRSGYRLLCAPMVRYWHHVVWSFLGANSHHIVNLILELDVVCNVQSTWILYFSKSTWLSSYMHFFLLPVVNHFIAFLKSLVEFLELHMNDCSIIYPDIGCSSKFHA
jgi:hypothetical protein